MQPNPNTSWMYQKTEVGFDRPSWDQKDQHSSNVTFFFTFVMYQKPGSTSKIDHDPKKLKILKLNLLLTGQFQSKQIIVATCKLRRFKHCDVIVNVMSC